MARKRWLAPRSHFRKSGLHKEIRNGVKLFLSFSLSLSHIHIHSLSLFLSHSFSLMMGSLALFLAVLSAISILAIKSPCGIDYKPLSNGTCVLLENRDVLRAMHFLALPQETATCKKVINVQDIAVCEDELALELAPTISTTKKEGCVIWSLISSNMCDHYGSLEFEIYWASRGCKVTIYQHLD